MFCYNLNICILLNHLGRALAQEKYIRTKTTQMSEFPELKKTSLKLNIAETILPDLEEFQAKSEQVLTRR